MVDPATLQKYFTSNPGALPVASSYTKKFEPAEPWGAAIKAEINNLFVDYTADLGYLPKDQSVLILDSAQLNTSAKWKAQTASTKF